MKLHYSSNIQQLRTVMVAEMVRGVSATISMTNI